MPHRDHVGELVREVRHSQRIGRAIFRWRNLIQSVVIVGFFVAALALQWGAAFLVLLTVSLLLICSVHILGPWLQRRRPHDANARGPGH